MSEYLVHLTVQEALQEILDIGVVRPGPSAVGAATNLTELNGTQHAVSLSEIPLDRLDRLVARHGAYGIAFTKTFIKQQRGAPVWYLARDTEGFAAFKELVRTHVMGGVNPAHPLWKLTPLVDYPGVGETWRYEFEWEREWRIVGDLPFTWYDDVGFVIAPDAAHAALRDMDLCATRRMTSCHHSLTSPGNFLDSSRRLPSTNCREPAARRTRGKRQAAAGNRVENLCSQRAISGQSEPGIRWPEGFHW
ncbi:abortive infection system antitoxin AbiGi family protein [Sphaerisporangium sp. NPDC005289]|uniref:abortive infection system antitoxin AbiGi family protein n=1 Tax=Sphaerisporangium sp. NPDC005289 TaxID=3155247 RepID=UPI0033A30208